MLEACRISGVKRFVLSSTSAVYGDPPKDGQFAYYPESAGFKLRVRCRGKVVVYQWPKSQFP